MNLLNKLHPTNPYIDFDHSLYELDTQGWNGEDPIFKTLIDQYSPSLIIEVGTWKGMSALYMGEYIKEKNLETKILCIDTWLGSIEHLVDPTMLKPVHGYPSLYYQFLANVKYKELENIIIPFPQTSKEASRWLKQQKIKSNLIYLDASHSEEDVMVDLLSYWDIFETPGVMIGDDYHEPSFPGVVKSVNTFCEQRNFELEIFGYKWIIHRP